MTTTDRQGEAILEAKDLGKYFQVGGGFRTKQLRALNEVSFALGQRQVVALVGESGSGKSTIARVLARLTEPSSGKIFFQGRDILQEEPRQASLAYRAQVQMIFQDPFGSLNPVHTIGYHLERPLLLHGKAKSAAELKDRVHELLETVELKPAAELAAATLTSSRADSGSAWRLPGRWRRTRRHPGGRAHLHARRVDPHRRAEPDGAPQGGARHRVSCTSRMTSPARATSRTGRW